MKIIAISDTHGKHDSISIPECDLLLHCGDYSLGGALSELNAFNKWLEKQPAKHKIVIPGNHDFLCQEMPAMAKELLTGGKLLIDESIEIEGFHIYGSPWTPKFFDWAFMKEDVELRRIWSRIPVGIDILITHGPPKGILDRTKTGMNVGSETLLERCSEVKPKYHFFGHIHEAYGNTTLIYNTVNEHGKNHTTDFYNVSTCDLKYRAVNKPVELEIRK